MKPDQDRRQAEAKGAQQPGTEDEREVAGHQRSPGLSSHFILKASLA